VGDFVGHDAGQFAFVLRQRDKTPEDVNVAPRGREGVDARAVDHVKLEIPGDPLLAGQDLFPDPADVIVDLLVFRDRVGLLEFFVDLASEFLFLLDGEARAGRGMKAATASRTAIRIA